MDGVISGSPASSQSAIQPCWSQPDLGSGPPLDGRNGDKARRIPILPRSRHIARLFWCESFCSASNIAAGHIDNDLNGVAPQEHNMRAALRLAIAILVLLGIGAGSALAQGAPPTGAPPPGAPPPGAPPPSESRFSSNELLGSGHRFFGSVSRGLAQVIEKAVSQWGLPNGYVLGEEGAGAFIAGLRYGEGVLYTKNAGDLKVYWQGPSIGFDAGGEGSRTMMLVYNLPNTGAIYDRFGGIDGSAYFIGGFGMTALAAGNVVLVPIRAGVGLRLGANVGYLKFTPQATWNPL
jgi:hypothetical protein